MKEDFEKQLKLGLEAINICEDIIKYIGEKDIMEIYKAKAYCEFFLSYNLVGVETTELKERCKLYLENLDNFAYDYYYKLVENIDNICLFNMRGMKIQQI